MNAFKKLGLACVCVVLVSCGRTGPETPKEPTGGKEPSVVSSAANTSSLSTSSEQNSSVPAGTEYTAVLEKAEITEGNCPIDPNRGPHLCPVDLVQPSVPLQFKLNKPLESDAKVVAVFDRERSTCARATNANQPWPQDAPVSVAKGQQKITLNAESRRDNEPEDDCEAAFNLKITYGDHEDLVVATGSLLQKDDDALLDETSLRNEKGDIPQPGDVVFTYLNGGKIYKGTTYDITQISGAKAEFKVIENKMRILVPEADEASRGDTIFVIKPSDGSSFKVGYGTVLRSEWPTFFDNITAGDVGNDVSSVDFLTGVVAKGYAYNNLITSADDLLKLRWELKTKSAQNRITLGTTELFNHKTDRTVGYPDTMNLLVLEGDGRTLRINPEALPTLKKYMLDDSTAFSIRTYDMVIDPTAAEHKDDVYFEDAEGGLDYYKTIYNSEQAEVHVNFRLAPRKITVHLEGIDADTAKNGGYRVMVRELIGKGKGNGRILPVTGLDTAFDHLTQGIYEVYFVDLNGAYSGVGIFNIQPHETTKTINLNLNLIAPKAKSAVSAVSVESSVTLKKTSATAKGSPVASLKMEKTFGDTAPDCTAVGGAFEVRSGAQDKKISCSREFTTTELRGSVPGISRQVVLEVESLEWPSFSSAGIKSTYNDNWQWQLIPTDLKVNSFILEAEAHNTVVVSHKDQRKTIYSSKCFTLAADSTDSVDFFANVTNIGDGLLNTVVRAKVIDCVEPFHIENARLENRGEKVASKKIEGTTVKNARQFMFAHTNENYNAGQPLIALPYSLNNTAYNATENAFGFTLDLMPQEGGDATKIDVKALKLQLQYVAEDGNERAVKILNLSELSVPASSAPNVEFADIKSVATAKVPSKVIGKRILVTNYRLPLNPTNEDNTPATYPVNNQVMHLLVSVSVQTDATSSLSTTAVKLELNDAKVGVTNNSDLRSLVELRALKIALPQAGGTRFDWDPVSNRAQTEREDDKGADGWMMPSLWHNLFVRERTALDCALLTNTSLISCVVGLSDNGSHPTIPDYLDELRVNDVSAAHIGCYSEMATATLDMSEEEKYEEEYKDKPKCRSRLGHGGHLAGTEIDLRYLDDTGSSGVVEPAADSLNKGLVGYSALWVQANKNTATATAAEKAAQKAARIKLHNWVYMNRKLIQWIIEDMALTTTPVTTVYLGDGTLNGAPNIFTIMTKGELPGTDSAGAEDDNLGAWNPSTLIKKMDPHDDHFHISFGISTAGDL